MDNHWQVTNHFDIAVSRLADRHYSRRTVGARQFRPPGQSVVLYIPGPDWPFVAAAAWVWWRPHPDKAKRYDGYDGFYNCSFFRNETTILSSELITESYPFVIAKWGMPELGFDTYVWPEKIRSTNPGYCYQMAGWVKDGWSKDRKKRRLYLPVDQITIGGVIMKIKVKLLSARDKND